MDRARHHNAISPVTLYLENLLESDPGLSPRTREYLPIGLRAIDDASATVARVRKLLVMVYGAVKRHAPETRIESAPGRGTRFRITLPVADEVMAVAPVAHCARQCAATLQVAAAGGRWPRPAGRRPPGSLCGSRNRHRGNRSQSGDREAGDRLEPHG
ncbi:MAG TPA: hypothetical protein VFA39_17060 [Steroidobacteraceae bacterium]|nr:hypothetical protein [Steroidobacteraceae bacterium]